MKTRGRFLVIIAGILWGFTGLFVRRLTVLGLMPMEIAFLRLLVALTILSCYLLIGRRRDIVTVKRKDLPIFIAAGLVSLTFFNFFYFHSIIYSTVAIAVCLLYTAPAFVVLLSALLFHEHITGRKAVALVIIFCGCVCASGVFVGDQIISPRGFFFRDRFRYLLWYVQYFQPYFAEPRLCSAERDVFYSCRRYDRNRFFCRYGGIVRIVDDDDDFLRYRYRLFLQFFTLFVISRRVEIFGDGRGGHAGYFGTAYRSRCQCRFCR